MNRKIILLFLVSILILSCDTTEPSSENENNTVTLKNETIGFSFSEGRAVNFPDFGAVIPDILALAHIASDGNVLGVFFASKNDHPTFRLIKEFSNADSARAFFGNLSEVPSSDYQVFALPVKPNQVWTVCTNKNNFGKILILETIAYYDSNALTTNVMAKFRWEYQPDGTKCF